MIPTQDQIKAAFKTATEDQKGYINSDELFNTFYTLRTKYHLHVDVAGNLALLIDAVILEILPLTEFPGKLKEILTGSSDVDYQAILKAINDDVFAYFRNKVRAEAEAAKKKAEQEAIEDAELEKQIQEKVKIAELEAAAAKTSTPQASAAPTAPTVQSTPTPAPSVLTQKITTISAPAQEQSKIVQPESKPATPPRYHGTDPYREMPE